MRLVPRVQLKNDSESQIWPVARNVPNNGAYEAKIYSSTPQLSEDQRLKGVSREILDSKPVIAKEPVIG